MDFIIEDVWPSSVPSNAMQDYETRTFINVVCTPESTIRVSEPDPVSDDSDSDSEPEVVYTSESFYNACVRRTPEECASEAAAPQRSLTWLEARKHCITASNFGAAAGHNKYMSPKALVLDKLWNVFKGNAFTAYGTFHEPDASKTLESLLSTSLSQTLKDIYAKSGGVLESYELLEVGLLKHADEPWMAVSPDGLLQLKGTTGNTWVLVEYKCPARLRHTEGHPYSSSEHCVPDYYMDQMQGIMGLLNTKLEKPCSASLFVVWQPLQVHVTLIPYKSEYYEKSLYPALRNWFFSMYLPLAVLKANGQLVPGTDTGASVLVLK